MTIEQTVDAESADEPALRELYDDLGSAHLQALWTITADLLTPVPRPQTVAWQWRADVLRIMAKRALDLVPVERGGERRVLSLVNPGLRGRPYVAGSLWGAVQCLRPAETAPAHRHTPGAIRFVLEGSGVWTTVNGVRCDMAPGDLVLTPSWNWHEHTSASDSHMLWFDGLDLPMVEALDAVFFEPHPAAQQPGQLAAPAVEGTRFVAGEVDGPLHPDHSPLYVYPRAQTDAELSRLAAVSNAPMVGLEFVNPRNGASVLPTLACGMHRIRAGAGTLPTRRTGSSVLVVYSGHGESVIDGQRFRWSAGDVLVVPSWSAVEHHATEQADFFSLTDAPVLRALGLFRTVTLEQAQIVERDFDGSWATTLGEDHATGNL